MNHITLLILSLLSFKGIGEVTILKFIQASEDLSESILDFSNLRKTKIYSITSKIDEEILSPLTWRDAIDESKKMIESTFDQGIIIFNFLEKKYPNNLRKLRKFPLLIYVKGNVGLLNYSKSVAVIGTRKPSTFGEKMGFKVSKLFADKEFSIISGLAKGCDTLAHKGALASSGKTVAILAHGLDLPIYPKINRPLADEILDKGGLLLSTHSNGTRLLPQYLAARDEWQSGLSDGVVIIETGIKGGTNITVQHAFSQEKPVGVLDHRQFKNGELTTLEQAQGNLKYLYESKAVSLYTEQSIEQFIRIILEEKKKDLSNDCLIKKSSKYDDNSEQLGLF